MAYSSPHWLNVNTSIHGIDESMVKGAPRFPGVFEDLRSVLPVGRGRWP